MSTSEHESGELSFKADCTIYEVADLYKMIGENMQNKTDIKLDLSSVERVDASFLQLLISTRLEAKKNNIKLEIDGVSDVVSELVKNIYCDFSVNDSVKTDADGE